MSLKPPYLFCVGMNHKTAPIELREQFYWNIQDLGKLLPLVKSRFNLQEIMILSTCNRIEVLGIQFSALDDLENLKNIFTLLFGPRISDLSQFLYPSSLDSKSPLYIYKGYQAIEHIFAVTASLDSLVIGETQITSQFKDALHISASCNCLGPILTRLAQEALATCKKVRRETFIGNKITSISHLAINLAKRVFLDLKEQSFLFVGAGEMIELAAIYAKTSGVQKIYIANRSPDRALNLIAKLGCGSYIPIDELDSLYNHIDCIICSTASPHFIISLETLTSILRGRKGRPLFIVDMALPRNVDPQCDSLEEVYLFDLDDLKKLVDIHFNERKKEADKGFPIIQQGALKFSKWLNSSHLKPIMGDFKEYLKDLMDREFLKTLSTSAFRDLSYQQKNSISRLLQSIGDKISSDAAKMIYSQNDTHSQDQKELLALSLKLLFLEHNTHRPKPTKVLTLQDSSELLL